MNQYVISTPTYRRGRNAAIEVHAREGQPNWDLLDRVHPEMRLGFKHAWEALSTGGKP